MYGDYLAGPTMCCHEWGLAFFVALRLPIYQEYGIVKFSRRNERTAPRLRPLLDLKADGHARSA